MKTLPFDLQKALQGVPVVTRDGKNVDEIKFLETVHPEKCIVAVVNGIAYFRDINGLFDAKNEYQHDLFMLEPDEEKTKGLNFGEALAALKQGKKLARKGWNGKGMFVYLVKGSQFTVNRATLNEFYPPETIINYRPHIDLKAADGTCGVWSISNNDALAEDWCIL